MLTSQGLGPAIPRRRLGAALRGLRDGLGKQLQEVARDLLISSSKLSRLEKGQGAPLERDIRDLLAYYGEQDTELGHRMWRWAEEGRKTPWWQDEAAVLSRVTDQYLQYETAASEIGGYVVDFVPTLLQTTDYARALRTALNPEDPQKAEALVRLTERRQEVITRKEYPVSLDIVVDEAVFHRLVGSPDVMAAQLLALAEAAARPNVRVRVYRFASGPNPAIAEGVFTLFHFRREIDLDVVNLEGQMTDSYIEHPADVQKYRRLLDGLRRDAQDPDSSMEFVRQMALSYATDPPANEKGSSRS